MLHHDATPLRQAGETPGPCGGALQLYLITEIASVVGGGMQVTYMYSDVYTQCVNFIM